MGSTFYAYIINIRNANTYRFVAAFASRAVADEWWRTVSTGGNASYNNIKRIAPQLYTHDPSVGNLLNFFSNNAFPKLFGKLFFLLLNDGDDRVLSIIPPQDITDHISGNYFYIRSKSDPSRYWYSPAADGLSCQHCDKGPSTCYKVHVSRTERTRFRIRARDVPQGTIIINSDRVAVSISDDLGLGYAADGSIRLIPGTQTLEFQFKDFENAFRARREEGRTLNVGPTGTEVSLFTEIVVRDVDDGERWELAA